MDAKLRDALIEGLTDATGFLVGALAGGVLARVLGFDFLGQTGWGPGAMAGILLVGLGAGLGRALVRRLVARNKT